jgi:predicted ester cyclase
VGIDRISENLWVWRWVLHATNTGSYRGLPPTGRTFNTPGCEFIELRADKVYRADGYFDRFAILSQLGLVPTPTTATAS